MDTPEQFPDDCDTSGAIVFEVTKGVVKGTAEGGELMGGVKVEPGTVIWERGLGADLKMDGALSKFFSGRGSAGKAVTAFDGGWHKKKMARQDRDRMVVEVDDSGGYDEQEIRGGGVMIGDPVKGVKGAKDQFCQGRGMIERKSRELGGVHICVIIGHFTAFANWRMEREACQGGDDETSQSCINYHR